MPQPTTTPSNEPFGWKLYHIDSFALPAVAGLKISNRKKIQCRLSQCLAKIRSQLHFDDECFPHRRSTTTTQSRLASTTHFEVSELKSCIARPKATSKTRSENPEPKNRAPELRRVEHSERILLHDEFAEPAWCGSDYDILQAGRRYQYFGQWCSDLRDSGRSTPTRRKPKDYYDLDAGR